MNKWEDIAIEIKNDGFEKIYTDNKDFYNKYGFYEEETWNLDYTIARFVLPRLAYLRENSHGYPSSLIYQDWLDALDKMILAFEHSYKEKGCDILTFLKTEEEYIKWEKEKEEGFSLFAKYFSSLWD